MGKYFLSKKYFLHALHNLNNPDWSDQKNLQVFGKCYRLHGHDFKIEVTLQGTPDATSGFLFHPEQMDSIVERKIIAPYQGRNLNNFFPNPSGEGLSIAFYDLLKEEFKESLHCVSINETLKNFFRYPLTEKHLY